MARLFEGSGLEYRIGVARGGQCWVQADDPHQCDENDLLKIMTTGCVKHFLSVPLFEHYHVKFLFIRSL